MAILKINTTVHTWVGYTESNFVGDPKEKDKKLAYLGKNDREYFPKFYLDKFNLEIESYERVVLKANLINRNWVSFTYVYFPKCKDLNDLGKPAFIDYRYCAVLCPDGRDVEGEGGEKIWTEPDEHWDFVENGRGAKELFLVLRKNKNLLKKVGLELEEIEDEEILSFFNTTEKSTISDLVLSKADFFDFVESQKAKRLLVDGVTYGEIDEVFNHSL